MLTDPAIAKSHLKILMSWVVALLCVVGLTAAPVAAQIAAGALSPHQVLTSSIQAEGPGDARVTLVKVDTDPDSSDSSEDSGDPCDTDDVESSAEYAVARTLHQRGGRDGYVCDELQPPVLAVLPPSSHRTLAGGARAPPLC